jgi:hypothetical protein
MPVGKAAEEAEVLCLLWALPVDFEGLILIRRGR